MVRTQNRGLVEDRGIFIFESPRIKLIHLSETEFLATWEYFLKYFEKGLSFTDYSLLIMTKLFEDNVYIAASDDGTIKIWNLTTNTLIKTLTAHSSFVEAVVFSPDGTILVSGSADEKIILWDTTDWTAMQTLSAHTDGVEALVFSPDGTRLVSAGFDNMIYVWDISSGSKIQTLSGHTEAIWCLSLSPDGKTLATGSGDYDQYPPPEVVTSTLKFWNLTIGLELLSLSDVHTNVIKSLAYSPDGTLLVSGSWDKTVKILNANIDEYVPTTTTTTTPSWNVLLLLLSLFALLSWRQRKKKS